MDARLFLCPRCGSLEVRTDKITHMGQLWDCPECGYHGSFVVEADTPEDARRLSKKIRADWEAGGEDARGSKDEEAEPEEGTEEEEE